MNPQNPIAVVGMAGLFPGAVNLDLFWKNIINKVYAVGEADQNRWQLDPDSMVSQGFRTDRAYSRHCCLIADFKFDPTGFALDKDLISALDPLHHIVLHVGREAIAGIHQSALNRQRTGVVLAAIALPTDATSAITRKVLGAALEEKLFAGVADYKKSTEAKSLSRNHYLAGRVTSLPAAVLAKSLGLGSGSYTLDAACASSLYAVKLACDELHAHRADAMLAGGVSRPDCLFTQVGFSQLRALSASGRCAPFDESADGLVVGEGAGIVVLKRLADALEDQDPIYGLIHAVGLSNDMRGNLLAPDSDGQLRAMRQAYDSCGWSPHDIDLIECHGAGTPLGDLTELKSLRNLWQDTGWVANQCAIGSVKSMIGHLLTAAGAAGMIKTLLALRHKILPPSLNFHRAPQNSPLYDSPFRIPTETETWHRKRDHHSRRAAVSAFGFGGINAHMLLEEYDENSEGGKLKIDSKRPVVHTSDRPVERSEFTEETARTIPYSTFHIPHSEIAVVGMEAVFGSVASLRDFQELIFNGETNFRDRPPLRWRGCDLVANAYLPNRLSGGGFCREISVAAGEYHIPPKEIQDILPQQLLMLKVAAGAMRDAGLHLREDRPDMGAIIGIDFDFEAANFSLRWHLDNMLAEWMKKTGRAFHEKEKNAWLETLKDACSPPLTATRTLGALGGIVASRIAREFRFGGPSFVVSCEDAGGLKALEIGARALQRNEADAFLIGAVDLSGDVRNIILADQVRPYSLKGQIRPFDQEADGTLPGEGAAALVIKRLDRAIADGNRIYSIIKGIGCSNGGGIDLNIPTSEAYKRSLKNCCQDADVAPAAISFVETHGSGIPAEDDLESTVLHEFFGSRQDPCAIGSVKANIGHTGATSGLAAVVKTSLSLYHEIMPPLVNFTTPRNLQWLKEDFHFPAYPQYWLRDRSDGARKALVGSMTADGNCVHVMLEGCDYEATSGIQQQILQKVAHEKKRPLGFQSFGLFCVEGHNRQALLNGLDLLNQHIENFMTTSAGVDASSKPASVEAAAQTWHLANHLNPARKYAVSIAAADFSSLKNWIMAAREAVLSDSPLKMGSTGGIRYSPHPLGHKGKLAFIFPGSGSHYLGMGRDIGVHWPSILHEMDIETSHLKTQMLPDCYIPWRVSWAPGWQQEAYQKIIADPLHMIFGQVVHGGMMANLIKHFGIRPSAVIGYSLGESAGYFAMNVWPERGEMLKRMQTTNLFTTELAGLCNAARQVWGIPASEGVDWQVAVVNRSADAVGRVRDRYPTMRLLIVNTPEECVIGGRLPDVKAAIQDLNCEAIFLDGVVTVHCDALKPVADAYRDLHIFPTQQPAGIRFYSCALGRAYELTSDKAANSILNQALRGFDFTATVNQAYQDGMRIFLELGPYSSCTRMINRILQDKPHLALSASVQAEQDYITIIKVLGALIAERVPVDLEKLYGRDSYPPALLEPAAEFSREQIRVVIGGKALLPSLPGFENRKRTTQGGEHKAEGRRLKAVGGDQEPAADSAISELIDTANRIAESTADAHQKFLELSEEITRSYAETFNLQTRLLERGLEIGEDVISAPEIKTAVTYKDNSDPSTSHLHLSDSDIPHSLPAFDRAACLEFAIGSVANVLGPEFAVVDAYAARVRLPDDPLMLVDRILSVEGQKGSLGSGRIVTEHDVVPGAWYLDGGHAPVCITVEAGQADLFLCAYLGIDLKVQGRRTYRLLDATVKFHRELPRPGETVRYEIEIEKFIRQGDTYLFLFHFKGTVGNTLLITMTNGCAGFFTEQEVKNSGGIILTEQERRRAAGKKPPDWQEFVPLCQAGYDDTSLQALRTGNLSACFGDAFTGITLPNELRLPDGRLKLIDRIVNLDPYGGRFGMGLTQSEADIHPDAWFLTCHFVDDMVMPGTLMYECCAQTLRVFLQRIGWVTEKSGVFYEPVREIDATLKCRGPVTPQTRRVTYEVEIKEIGYRPEPYVIADAYMYADGHRIVYFRDMSMQMSNITGNEIESGWRIRRARSTAASIRRPQPVVFDRSHMLEFAAGRPSKAFGDPYEPFDRQRFIARLPQPPYLLIDRIVKAEPEAWVLKPDGWIEAECDVDPDAWYFRAERTPAAPISIMLEIALQPCGWLAAYMGSALRSENELRFRNLGGNAILHGEVRPDAGTLTIKTRLTKASEAADMIIEHFDFEVQRRGQKIYTGNTYFGFFTQEALAQQEGIRDAVKQAYMTGSDDIRNSDWQDFVDCAPFQPQDPASDAAPALALPAKAIRMIDRIEAYLPAGGTKGLGFIRGTKTVDPQEWFFKAHFYQDPVCPGSLGIESFIQLLKFAARERWPQLMNSHRFGLVTGAEHDWIYRGQILPANRQVTVEAEITHILDDPDPCILADGFLKVDGLYIYQMKNFGIKLVEI